MEYPQFMIDNPNWMNTPELPETVFVDIAGQVHPTTNGIHLDRWLRAGGQIVPAPDATVIAPVPIQEAPIAPALKDVPDIQIVEHPEREAQP
jgi:hypothetical protein